jgi:uncharacterized protein (DUF2267 family)
MQALPVMTTIPAVFQSTVTKSNQWLAEVMSEMAIHDPHKALRALRASLHAIRDLLPPSEAVGLAAQLPMLLRGLYYEGWRFGDRPDRARDPAALLAAIREELGDDPTIRPEEALRATIHTLAWHVSAGELDDVAHVLPRRVAELWSDCLA